jgi:hypothetical protein
VIRQGSRADLCVLTRPLQELTEPNGAVGVRATFIAGEPAHVTG